MSPESPEPLRVVFLVADALDRLGVRHHVGGSLASSIHGVPRQTQDVDLVVALDLTRVRPLVEALEGDFYVDEASARRGSGALTRPSRAC